MAANKIKPSVKEYRKDKNGKKLDSWFWKHYTVKNTTTDELLKLYSSPSYARKKSMILKELTKRGIQVG